MSSNIFFKKKNIQIKKIFKKNYLKNNFIVNDIKPLNIAKKNDLSFFDTIKYKQIALKTNSGACITTSKLEKFLPDKVQKIIVKNVLLELAKALKAIYPLADVDYPDLSLKNPNNKSFKNVKFGNNVLIGNNVKIGNSSIIGSGVIIKNSLIGDRVMIQDNCKIGQKGFGFIPIKDKNIKFPHIGKVVIEDDVEIASSCTIDRGSVDDTCIGKNTYLDNQVHVAHNVKIGANCMIAGQVGFAGSSNIGNNVLIGGQAGISGHLKVGSNVKIGGGSGVVKDIQDNQIVMGYPAIPLREFLKKKQK